MDNWGLVAYLSEWPYEFHIEGRLYKIQIFTRSKIMYTKWKIMKFVNKAPKVAIPLWRPSIKISPALTK